MSRLPSCVSEYFTALIGKTRSPALLVLGEDGRLHHATGALDLYGLSGLQVGENAAQTAYFLEGLLPPGPAGLVLSRVQTVSGVFADIHVFACDGHDCVLLLDSTEEVTERSRIEEALRLAEEHLRQAEKMEAVGRLAGGVAHDFNNLLTVILGYSDMMLRSMRVDDAWRNETEEVYKAAERAAQLTGHLLTFSRKQVLQTQVLNLNAVVEQMRGLLRPIIGEDIEVETKLYPGLSRVEVDRGQIEQVIINLTANARDAMPRGGKLLIETRNICPHEVCSQGCQPQEPSYGCHVLLEVSDTGCGMDAETRARAFDPFFTTKERGRGTGLGLATVYGIVRQSGGAVELHSQPGRGTRVSVRLPRACERAQPLSPLAEPVVMEAGSETILVVEDEEPIRDLIRTVLGTHGYTVLESHDGPHALKTCHDYKGTIHLMLSDLVMPHMTGPELAERVVNMRSGTKVLFMTGYAQETIAERGMPYLSDDFLQKPFTADTLMARVRAALDNLRTPSSARAARA